MYHAFLTEVLSTDALCRDGMGQISRDQRTKHLKTRREWLAMPSKYTKNHSHPHIYLYIIHVQKFHMSLQFLTRELEPDEHASGAREAPSGRAA